MSPQRKLSVSSVFTALQPTLAHPPLSPTAEHAQPRAETGGTLTGTIQGAVSGLPTRRERERRSPRSGSQVSLHPRPWHVHRRQKRKRTDWHCNYYSPPPLPDRRLPEGERQGPLVNNIPNTQQRAWAPAALSQELLSKQTRAADRQVSPQGRDQWALVLCTQHTVMARALASYYSCGHLFSK